VAGKNYKLSLFHAFPSIPELNVATGKPPRLLLGMSTHHHHPEPNLDPIERQRWLDAIIPLQEAAQLRGVHVETLKREAKRGRLTLIRVSERRLGIRRRDALAIPA
jgi:hypothetical protein